MSGVRGPNSALTEFLRSQGISANEIRLRHERRQRATDQGEEQTEESAQEVSTPTPAADDPEVASIAAAAARKRKRDADDEADEGTALCDVCHSRFTLTVYTRESSGGGYLCRNCTDSQRQKSNRSVKSKSARNQRKKLATDLLDLRNSVAPTLQDLCISVVAQYIDDVDELGDLTLASFSRLGRILCKNRRLTPRTLQLLLHKDVTSLELWDCSKLTPESYNLIPSMCPNLRKLTLGMCGQLTGESLVRFAQQLPNLTEIHLDGPFLVRKASWLDFFDIAGPRLKGFTVKSVYRVDAEVLAVLIETCSDSLEYLSLHRLSQMNDYAPLFMLGSLNKLRHLELADLEPDAWSDTALRASLNMIGSQLSELVIRGPESCLGDSFIDAIAASCGSLIRLELQNLTEISNESVVNMFQTWMSRDSNVGLNFLCLERCNQLGDEAIQAALSHSQHTLVDLNINSLRKLSPSTFDKVAALPQLTRLDMGFVGCADPIHIYKLATSKTLKQVLAYGNIRLSGMPLPTGLTVVGTM